MSITFPARTHRLDPMRLERITDWMQGHIDAGRLAGLAVQITHKGEIAYSRQAGRRDRENDLPVEADTLWRIYSMTKPITSLAALMLYEEGAFQLDQPVSDFLPRFSDTRVWKGEGQDLGQTLALDRPMTIHDLLNSSVGTGLW